MKFGFQEQLFMKNPRTNLQGILFSRCSLHCRSKTPILAKINLFLAFLARSSEMQNMFGRLHFKPFYRPFQTSKNIGRIVSHSGTIWRNVNVASFFAPDNGTYQGDSCEKGNIHSIR